MVLTTWCGSKVDTRDYRWTVWLRWAQGWLTAGWRPMAFRLRARERRRARQQRRVEKLFAEWRGW